MSINFNNLMTIDNFDSSLHLENFNITFKNIEYLIDFMNYTKDIEEWETQIFRLTASNGMQMNIDTAINSNSYNNKDYVEYKKLKKILLDFYTQNKNLSINMEIKFKLPHNMKSSIDPDDYFHSFHINCYSDQLSSYISVSFFERDIYIPAEPVKNWVTYIVNLYDQWTKTKSF